ncbi:MAG: hypothetical protein ACI9IA_000043 [Enterobacterales bacterium]
MQPVNEEGYQKLCKASKKILTASDVTVERISVSWLHILRAHPSFLSKYSHLFENVHWCMAYAKLVVKKTRYKCIWFIRIVQSSFMARFNYSKDSQDEHVDVLFISHLLNAEQLFNEKDFYYGDLVDKLLSQKYTAHTAFINHTKLHDINKVLDDGGEKVNKYIFSNALSLKEEINIFNKLKKECKEINRIALSENLDFNKNFYRQASVEALSQNSAFNLRLACQLEMLINKLQARFVVLTYEGHAWERVFCSVVRNFFPDVKIIAYVHSVLFYKQDSLFQSFAQEFKPDYVLTTGEVSKNQLKKSHVYSNIPISVLGSSRVLDNKENGDMAYKNNNKNVCLVLPEGIISECNLLFEFSLGCAKIMPCIDFIWRLHPSVSFDLLLKENCNLEFLPKNIVLSDASIEDDMSRSSWGLYRGSTAIIQSVISGLTPIYLEVEGEITINPLYEFSHKIKKVKGISDFKNIFEKANVDDQPSKDLMDYCIKIYQPYNVHSLTKIIQ